MSTSGRVLLVALALATVAVAVQAGKVTKFSREMNVPLYTNKIGPFANPSVAYHYNSYPLCKPVQAEPKKQRQGLVDKLDGTFKQPSLYAIKYKSTYYLLDRCSARNTLVEEQRSLELFAAVYWPPLGLRGCYWQVI